MEIKTFKGQYKLLEFDHHIEDFGDTVVNVLDLLVSADGAEYIEDELNNIFAIDTEKHSYIFSGYEVSECYITEDGFVKVVCVK